MSFAPIRRLIVLAVLVSLAICTGASARGTTAATVTITLLSPTSTSQVPRTKLSPLFTWQVSGLDAEPVNGIEELEVSTDPSFSGSAGQNFTCTNGTCPGQYQWNTAWWYTESDLCTYDPPPATGCSNGRSTSGVLYWRVSLLSHGAVEASATGSFSIFQPKDTTPPRVRVRPGVVKRGNIGWFTFEASDDSGPVREELDLYKGKRLMLIAHHGWNVLPPTFVSWQVAVPLAIPDGTYTWCLTAFDQAGNHTKSCAGFTVVG